jgi:hypothetical protein
MEQQLIVGWAIPAIPALQPISMNGINSNEKRLENIEKRLENIEKLLLEIQQSLAIDSGIEKDESRD